MIGKSISAVAFGKLTIAEMPSVLFLEIKVEHDTFFKADKARLGRKHHEGSLFCSS
jgi:hypothetical protein